MGFYCRGCESLYYDGEEKSAEIARLRERVSELETDAADHVVLQRDARRRAEAAERRIAELVRRGWVRIPYRMHDVEHSRPATSVDDLFAALDAARKVD